MKRHIPGLHSAGENREDPLDGLFLVQIQKVSYRWHSRKPFFEIAFSVVEPQPFEARSFTGRLFCTDKALWKLNWFLRDFGYDSELLGREHVDEKSLLKLKGIVRTSSVRINGRCFQNLDAFAPSTDWNGLNSVSISNIDEVGEANDL
ncbi:MAG TPA: hypothetical protein VN982_17185 [Candidatus Dormibacteraeota bacterium]|nr:hypothetical protein [Candidatus Dormibacteraeota bacterium]